jgi:hypothetical protein
MELFGIKLMTFFGKRKEKMDGASVGSMSKW